MGYIAPKINCKVVKEGPCSSMIFFNSKLSTGDFVLFASLVDRIPTVRDEMVVLYSFEHYIKILALGETTEEINSSIDDYLTLISKDEDRYIEHADYPSFSNTFTRDEIFYRPKYFTKVFLSWEESHQVLFNNTTNRWVTAERIIENDKTHENSLIKQLADSGSCEDFLKVLNTIPNFKIKLTEEQQELVASSGNVLTIGRSGTGKTTCSILRMFSSEIIFKYRAQRGKRKLTPDDLNKSSSLHCVFVTASPVLVNEVKRFYGKLNTHMKDEIKAREEAKKSKEIDVEEITLEQEESIDLPEDHYEEYEEKTEEGPTSMTFLRDEDFPLFVTIRKLIFLIDGTLRRPFFDRNLQGNVISTNTNFEWHTDSTTNLRVNTNLNKQSRDDMGLSSNSESSEGEAEYYQESQHAKAYIYKPVKTKEKYRWFRHRNFEVDFKVFKEKFWPKVKQKTTLSALVIWTEISAYIKGSADSYSFKPFYLPKNVYAYRNPKSSFLSLTEKWLVWDICMEYEK